MNIDPAAKYQIYRIQGVSHVPNQDAVRRLRLFIPLASAAMQGRDMIEAPDIFFFKRRQAAEWLQTDE